MPIYEYKCGSCQYEKDELQKINDKLLTKCPNCEKDEYKKKEVSKSSFQLKGSGWFKDGYK